MIGEMKLNSLNRRLSIIEQIELRLYNLELKVNLIFDRQEILEEKIRLLELWIDELNHNL